MAANTNPIFLLTPNNGRGTITAANTARDGTGSNIVTVFTAGSNGSRVEEVIIKSTGQPANSVVTMFLHDGSAFYLRDEFVISGTPAAGSTTAAAYAEGRTYRNLTMPSGWTIRFACTIVMTSGGINVFCMGGDY